MKKVSLNISQNSQENTCVGVKGLQLYYKRDSDTQFFPVNFAKFEDLFCRTSANGCFFLSCLMIKFVKF